MICYLYDDIQTVIKELEKNKLTVIFKESAITVYNGNDFLVIDIKKVDNSIRTFSIPLKSVCNELLINKSLSEDLYNLVTDIVSKKCMEYSDNEISTILNDMKITKDYAENHKGILNNVAIIWRDHFLEENIGLLSGFVTLGVKPNDILALDKGDSTLHRFEITATFKKMGFNVDVLDNSSLEDKKLMEIGTNMITNFISERKDKKIIILDDGAIISKILNKVHFDNIISIIELTEMGLRRINKLDKIDYPILNVAKTKLKRNLVYPEISNSLFIRIIELLGGEKLVGRSAVLCGYGDMGEILAERFRALGVRVSIVDIDIMRLIVAGERGFNTYDNIVDAVKNEKPFIIIGASGYYSITKDIFQYLDEKTYITAGATADLNVFNEYKANSTYVPKLGTIYCIGDKNIIVLGNGRSVNLYYSEAIPNKSNDIFKAGTLVTACNSVINANDLQNGVKLNVVDEWINSSGILEEYYKLYISSSSKK